MAEEQHIQLIMYMCLRVRALCHHIGSSIANKLLKIFLKFSMSLLIGSVHHCDMLNILFSFFVVKLFLFLLLLLVVVVAVVDVVFAVLRCEIVILYVCV